MIKKLAIAITMLTCTSALHAATLTAQGATGVQVGNNFYDVTFIDDSCDSIWDECSSVLGRPSFTFNNEADAMSAASALLDLFNLPAFSSFDLTPHLTDGCDFVDRSCSIHTPYAVDGTSVFSVKLLNHSDDFRDGVSSPSSWSYHEELSQRDRDVYAQWAVNPVPVPAAVWLFGSGLIGLIGVARRKKA